jgi:hypothetical protein
LQQAKSSRGESISVKLADLELLIQNTRRLNRSDGGDRVPAMLLHFVTDRAVLAPRAWALVPLEHYNERKTRPNDEDLG